MIYMMYNSFLASFPRAEIWFFLTKWWSGMAKLKEFPVACARQSFSATRIAGINFIQLNLQFSLKLYSCLRIPQLLRNLLTLKTCFTKFVLFTQKRLKWKDLLSISISLLNHKNCKIIAEGNFIADKNFFLQAFIIFWQHFGNAFRYFLSMFNLEWNLNSFPRYLCINTRVNIFLLCVLLTSRCFTHAR